MNVVNQCSLWGVIVVLETACGFTGSYGQATDGRTYYVSSSMGSLPAGGASEATAWKELDQVNAAGLKPGDTVLFRRGDTCAGSCGPGAAFRANR